MKYTVNPWIFECNPDIIFGIVIGKGLKNSETSESDTLELEAAERLLRERVSIDEIKTHPDFLVYRNALTNVGINPNKFMNSVEAMGKRVIKGDQLPRINALVDLCNTLSLKNMISLGGHDLADIDADLMVRKSVVGDEFLPFGKEAFEQVPPDEVVFTSGNKIQTRQWLWRQSELGKMTLDTKDVFFQMVGFKGEHLHKLQETVNALETLIETRFEGTYETFFVDAEHNAIEFKY
ncbi:B3/B4 domain-containing protein [Fusibacter ferrireducens]|uniref:B3/B4 tRNA-binding domain-containing protein n=1 Tax=Fusibacter ferrireducens TaxID=2785058 RepID=A0ABR9ZQC3_9FIRM|nr:phenylalanine--tRNA ligase beta subunit-related protein [Fusibacter ferrireducens]MBF4692660.1 hypothetical protein [Fusibacter ferrireducens]